MLNPTRVEFGVARKRFDVQVVDYVGSEEEVDQYLASALNGRLAPLSSDAGYPYKVKRQISDWQPV